MNESAQTSRLDRLQLRLEIERLRTVRCVMWSMVGLMFFVSASVIAAMAHYSGQGNHEAARLFNNVLVAMFPSLATVMVAVSAIIHRSR